jgi:hypothetical protein
MQRAKQYAFRSSKSCSTCEDLQRLKASSEAVLRKARNLYRTALHATHSAALQNLEEEFKQTSAAPKLICYAVHAHLTKQHSQACGDRLARNGPGKES